MQVTINVPDQLAAEAAAKGLAVDVYVEEVLSKQLQDTATQPGPRGPFSRGSAAQAVERIRALRQGVTLDGLKIKDLIHEGHKH